MDPFLGEPCHEDAGDFYLKERMLKTVPKENKAWDERKRPLRQRKPG